jgi:hypothetical protein
MVDFHLSKLKLELSIHGQLQIHSYSHAFFFFFFLYFDSPRVCINGQGLYQWAGATSWITIACPNHNDMDLIGENAHHTVGLLDFVTRLIIRFETP